MGAVVELTDEAWGLVEHLFDPPVHRGVKGTIPRRDIVDARPHDVQAARRILMDQLDLKHPALPGHQAIVADRGYTRLLALANNLGLNLDIRVPPAPPVRAARHVAPRRGSKSRASPTCAAGFAWR